MLQTTFIRQYTDLVKQRLAIKNFKQLQLVDELLQWDEKRKQYQQELEEIQAKINASSKVIGQLMAGGQKEEAEKKKAEVSSWKQQQDPGKLNEAEKNIEAILYLLPNLPSEKVPTGKTPEDNIIIREGGTKPSLPAGAVPHWDLAKKYNLIDFELGNKITGSGFPVYINKGAKLQRSLIQ
ncbi:MAG: serine--tRNA ligase, partial [Chitinophagaceae bacterium]